MQVNPMKTELGGQFNRGQLLKAAGAGAFLAATPGLAAAQTGGTGTGAGQPLSINSTTSATATDVTTALNAMGVTSGIVARGGTTTGTT